MKNSIFSLFCFVLLCISLCKSQPSPLKFNNDSMLYGCILPHSHDDVGWLLTINEYYELLVRHIYNGVVEALSQNPNRKFISVEMAFLHKWWTETATTLQKQQLKQIVKNGQLEFIIGGMTMEDEGCTTYSANIDQMTEGHRFIWENFGVRPRFGWQIDPFGASSVVHEQFALMGFDGTVVDRVFSDLKGARENSKQLEFVWQPSHSYGDKLQIFTHMMDHYAYSTAVSGLTWDKADPPVNDSNVKSLADNLVKNIKERAQYFKTNIILFPWGDDFAHFIATVDFNNMDKLLQYINDNSNQYGVQVQYCTLGDYFSQLYAKNLTWDVYAENDFFPYGSPDNYWTGYFTSRSALKGYARTRENVLRTGEILNVLSSIKTGTNASNAIESLNILRQASAEATHHDAVAGTAEPWVVEMYEEHLDAGTQAVTSVLEDSIKTLVSKSGGSPNLSTDQYGLKYLTPERSIPVVAYNSLAWTVNRYISVPIYRADVQVIDAKTNKPVTFQVEVSPKTYAIPCQYYGTCGYPNNSAPYSLFIQAQIPPLGYSTYIISVSKSNEEIENPLILKVESKSSQSAKDSTFIIENNYLSLTFSNSTGHLLNIANKKSKLSTSVANNFFTYIGEPDMKGGKSEGAYIFHPLKPATPTRDNPSSQGIVGKYVQEVRQFFTDPCIYTSDDDCGITQTFRLYSTDNSIEEIENYIEVLSSVGPVGINHDIVSRFSTNLNSNLQIYTDDNCFESLLRTYDPKKSDPIGGNYYPITCGAYIRDKNINSQFSILTDRTRAGGSLTNGEVEIMIHRRAITTDFKGPLDLDDTDHLENVQYLLIFDTVSSAANLKKRLQYYQQFPPTLFFGQIPSNSAWNYPATYSPLKKDFPSNVHLLTLQLGLVTSSNVTFRLAHIYEKDDGSTLSQPVTLNLVDYFAFASVTQLEERSLTGIWALKDLHRWNWKTSSSQQKQESQTSDSKGDFVVTLNPVEIKTFYINLKSN